MRCSMSGSGHNACGLQGRQTRTTRVPSGCLVCRRHDWASSWSGHFLTIITLLTTFLRAGYRQNDVLSTSKELNLGQPLCWSLSMFVIESLPSEEYCWANSFVVELLIPTVVDCDPSVSLEGGGPSSLRTSGRRRTSLAQSMNQHFWQG